MSKKNKTRAKQAVQAGDAMTETLNYLLHVRGGEPTSPAQAAEHLHISPAAAGQRFTRLVTLGQVEKLKRGLFRGSKMSGRPLIPAGSNTLDDMLAFLYAERDRINIRIQETERTRDLHREWLQAKDPEPKEKR